MSLTQLGYIRRGIDLVGNGENEIFEENVGEMLLFNAEIENKSKKARVQIKGEGRSLK